MAGAAAAASDAGAAVRRAIERHHLLPPRGKVVLGFSGGPDSLALLHILVGLVAGSRVTLHAAHLNHCLRGEEADADAAFCAAVCAEWGVPLTMERRDVGALAQCRGIAVEEAARQARYSFLGRVAEAQGANTVAVAHNADDQVETVLMHFLRGSGLAGLRGMLPSVPLSELRLGGEAPAPEGVALVRPLLSVPRSSIECYLAQHGLTPRFDRSNLDTTYHRNRLRLELVPYLETFQPNVRDVIGRTAEVLSADYDCLHTAVDRAWRRVLIAASERAVVLDRGAYSRCHLSLRRSIIRRAISTLRPSLRNVGFAHVEQAVEAIEARRGAGTRVTLPDGLMLSIDYDRLAIAEADEAAPFPARRPQLLRGAEEQRFSPPACLPLALGARFKAAVHPVESLPKGSLLEDHPWEAYLDADYAGEVLFLRGRREGERMQPLGMGGHSKRINELMINLKIPAGERRLYPLLAGTEHVLWLPGYNIDHRARVTEATKRVLVAKLEEAWA